MEAGRQGGREWRQEPIATQSQQHECEFMEGLILSSCPVALRTDHGNLEGTGKQGGEARAPQQPWAGPHLWEAPVFDTSSLPIHKQRHAKSSRLFFSLLQVSKFLYPEVHTCYSSHSGCPSGEDLEFLEAWATE